MPGVGIGNTLYPPIVDTYMPAFVREEPCRVYFSLSSYNSINDIKNVQIIVNNQNTNFSALRGKLETNEGQSYPYYPAGVKIANIQTDTSVDTDYKYFVEISPNDIYGGFELNQFYKVQLRFTGREAEDLTNYQNGKIASWLTNNQQFFSEWSTVCLIKGIERPDIYLNGFENQDSTEEITFTTEVVDFIGRMFFTNNNDIEKEYLKSYKIEIYNSSTEEKLFDSGEIYTEEFNPNEINYNLPYGLERAVEYRVKITYTTINGYVSSKEYLFNTISNAIDALNATITATADEENGRIDVLVKGNVEGEQFLGNLAIRRTSNKSNYTIWEDICIVTLGGTPLNYTFADYTIESGTWYRYCAQKINSKGQRGSIIQIRNPIMVVLDHIFLTRDNMQLKIKYDPDISSFKYTIADSKAETIGSKYPFIKRNGSMNYRQFPISGLITWFCDEDGIFLNKENIYQYESVIKSYEEYNKDNDIDQYQDYIYEREFRNKVIDFLQDGKVKLFRSTTEGNILVRLMDVSFTPNKTLGRMLYSFSATACEIDECNIKNYIKYGIHSVGQYSTAVEYSYQKLGQLVLENYGGGKNALEELQDKLNSEKIEGQVSNLLYLKWIRIEFESDPYLINVQNNIPVPVDLDPNPSNWGVVDKNTIYGYIVYINGVPIVVSPRNYYELCDSDTVITSVSFPEGTSNNVIINYIMEAEQAEDVEALPSKLYGYTRVGQLWGMFNVDDLIIDEIYSKYFVSYENQYYERMTSVDKVTIETYPGTIIYVKDSFDDNFYKHIVGDTGILELYDEESVILGLYFGGVHLIETEDPGRSITRETEFIETGEVYDTVDEIKHPKKNGVYQINTPIATMKNLDMVELKDFEYAQLLNNLIAASDNRYIYYNSNWYVFSVDNDVLCPAEGLINYIYELIKGVY